MFGEFLVLLTGKQKRTLPPSATHKKDPVVNSSASQGGTIRIKRQLASIACNPFKNPTFTDHICCEVKRFFSVGITD